MNVKLITMGKTSASYLREGELEYQGRLKHYMKFERIDLNDLKVSHKTSSNEVKKKEAKLILKQIKPTDQIVLLDENGQDLNSVEFSKWFEKKSLSGVKNLVFLVGGAFGFDKPIYERANDQIRLSSLTFSHQMVRLFFLEQLYRAGSILKREKYHHQ
tara:strand:- start:269 stop:742 length:474 start_codon:yes stop_codon:yes gene_type:complete